GLTITGATAFARRVVRLTQPVSTKAPSRLAPLGTMLTALLLIGIVAVSFDVLAHGVAWQFGPAVKKAAGGQTVSLTDPVEETALPDPERPTTGAYALWVSG